ncbi:rhomboid family intramembrane serine protease [Mesonia sp. K7]|uniref:rhomboid family intramembrane serine protease n=1 Tax=Mesonia sp. K7 TaxID=2218606 RepID=UPI000DA96D6F|nr:rhomboid family intramembrane serine protease [Mesonia sp. K7]PZD78286.1 rhomboid family intramembrane serine protease [Mesonia sp. K7]
MTWQEKLKYHYQKADVVQKLIAVLVIVFVIQKLVEVSGTLFGFDRRWFIDWFAVWSPMNHLLFHPWSIITYGFLHGGFIHLLFNVLVLYFSANLFLSFFNEIKLLSYFTLGVIVGGLFFVVFYQISSSFAAIPLVGASAGIMAILIGAITQSPNMEVYLRLIGRVKLWWIAAVFVLLDLIQTPISNIGGHLAHLGGAFAGFLYTHQLKKGVNIGAWLENIISRLFFENWKQTKHPFKKVYKNKTPKSNNKSKQSFGSYKTENQFKVDAILEKIKNNGYESLTKEEKDFLYQAGKNL